MYFHDAAEDERILQRRIWSVKEMFSSIFIAASYYMDGNFFVSRLAFPTYDADFNYFAGAPNNSVIFTNIFSVAEGMLSLLKKTRER